VEVRDQLLRLVRLQEVALEIRTARGQVESAPFRLESIEQRFRERNAEYVAVRQRFEALEEDRRIRSEELEILEQSRRKFSDDLMQVKNQREYAAILREIDGVKDRISEHEDAILKDLEELEAVKIELATHESHIQEERKLVESERTEVESAVSLAEEAMTRLNQERTQVVIGLPRELLSSVHRLEEGRQGLFLSKVVDGVCQACYVRLRPQGFQEVRQLLKIHACSNCKRLLYYEPSLRPRADGPGADSVEAVNGGAV
jgi:uncharacterized protein